MPRMDDTELKSIVATQISSAVGFTSDELVTEREEALKRYRGDPYGDELENHSQVVSRDVMDVVEWIMPALIKVFHGNDRVVEFEPNGPEDEEAAEQATDYINFVYNCDNPGFTNTYTWFKDALIQKVGVLKHWWDEEERIVEQNYQGLSPDELTQIAGSEGVEILEQEEALAVLETPEGPSVPFPVHNIKIRRTFTHEQIRVEPVPPEEFLISQRSKSLERADFTAHQSEKTASDLIAEGYPRDLVDRLPGDEDPDVTGEAETRYQDEDDTGTAAGNAMRKIVVSECYLPIDVDGDGIAELRQVVLAGGAGSQELLPDPKTKETSQVIDEIPFSTWSPIMMPHKFFGMSIADTVLDLAQIKTALWRKGLDSLYFGLDPELEVVWDDVHEDGRSDVLESRPGGIKRVLKAQTINPLAKPLVTDEAYKGLAYVDQVMEGRTGVSRTSKGTNPDLLQNQTATAVNDLRSAARERIDLIARVIAETGMRRLMTQLLKLTVKHQQKERVIRLRGEWVEIDPRAWNADMDVGVDVGLGTGNKDQQLAHLNNILERQVQALDRPDLGLVKPKNIFNTLEKMTKMVGLASVEPFFVDPESQEGQQVAQQGAQQSQQQPGNAEAQAFMAAEQMKAQQKAAEAQASNQLELIKLKLEDDRERDKMAIDAALKEAELAARYNAQVNTAALNAEVNRERNFAAAVQSAGLGNPPGNA